jgi:hypothetical protein
MQAVDSIYHDTVKLFIARQQDARVTPSELVDDWLPWVHIAIDLTAGKWSNKSLIDC